MRVMASLITVVSIVYYTVSSSADQRKYQSFALLAFVRGNHRRPVISPHKGPVTRKMFPFDDVIKIIEPRLLYDFFSKCFHMALRLEYFGESFQYYFCRWPDPVCHHSKNSRITVYMGWRGPALHRRKVSHIAGSGKCRTSRWKSESEFTNVIWQENCYNLVLWSEDDFMMPACREWNCICL